MKQVRMKTLMAGPEGCFYPGQVISVEDDLTVALVAGGYAEMIDKPTPEAAVIDTPEKAVLPTPKRKAVK